MVTSDGAALPFPASIFDGATADRTLQHTTDAASCIDELVRVTKTGGRIVLADPDYSTQTLEIADQELAAGVLAFRAQRGLRNGTLAHRHAGMLATRGLTEISVDAFTVVVRDPATYQRVWGLRTWARPAADLGYISAHRVLEFERQFDDAVMSGAFTYTLTFFVTAGTVSR